MLRNWMLLMAHSYTNNNGSFHDHILTKTTIFLFLTQDASEVVAYLVCEGDPRAETVPHHPGVPRRCHIVVPSGKLFIDVYRKYMNIPMTHRIPKIYVQKLNCLLKQVKILN